VLKVQTLKKRKEFLRIAARCHKFMMPAFILQVADNPQPENDYVRIGFTASKRVGGAVERNRAKRRLRALVREIFPSGADKHFDYVLIAKTYCLTRNYEKMRNELKSVLERHKGSVLG
jgi:ribonuclease P protein component